MKDIVISNDMNHAHIIGNLKEEVTYSHIFNDEIFYFLELEVKNSNNNKKNIVQVFVPEKYLLIDGSMPIVNSTLEVLGKLVHTKVNGKLDVAILADTVSRVDDSTKNISEVYVSGEIYSSYDINNLEGNKSSKNFLIKHVDSEDNSKYFILKVSSWNSLAKIINEKYKEGDNIIIKGIFESIRVEEDSKSYYLHRLLAKVVLNGSDKG